MSTRQVQAVSSRIRRVTENSSMVIGPTSRGTHLDQSLAGDREHEARFAPVQQCTGCMAPVRSLCECEPEPREDTREPKARSAKSRKPKAAPRQVSSVVDSEKVAAIFEAQVEAAITKVSTLPTAMIQTYLASLSPKLRVAVLARA